MIVQTPKLLYTDDGYIKYLQIKLNISFAIARKNITNSSLRSKQYYERNSDSIELKFDDSLVIYSKQSKPNLSKKLSPNFKWHYKVNVFVNKTV